MPMPPTFRIVIEGRYDTGLHEIPGRHHTSPAGMLMLAVVGLMDDISEVEAGTTITVTANGETRIEILKGDHPHHAA